MVAVEEWTSKESDSLPEEGIATAGDIVIAEETPLEGRIVVAEEKLDAAIWESIFWVLVKSKMKRNTKSALIPS